MLGPLHTGTVPSSQHLTQPCLGSSRVGSDQTHVARVVKLDVIQGERLRVNTESHHKSWRRFNLGRQIYGVDC